MFNSMNAIEHAFFNEFSHIGQLFSVQFIEAMNNEHDLEIRH
jgi:hypothetical protein